MRKKHCPKGKLDRNLIAKNIDAKDRDTVGLEQQTEATARYVERLGEVERNGDKIRGVPPTMVFLSLGY